MKEWGAGVASPPLFHFHYNFYMPKPFVVLTTFPANDIDSVDDFIEKLLMSRLCACVNKIKVESQYWWDNKIQKDPEYLLVVKTTDDKLQELETWIKKNHPYTVPEFIALNVERITEPYHEWLVRETR